MITITFRKIRHDIVGDFAKDLFSRDNRRYSPDVLAGWMGPWP